MKYLLGILLLCIIALSAAFLFPEPLGTKPYVDFSPPTLSLSREKGELVVKADDELSGVAEISLTVKQEDKEPKVLSLTNQKENRLPLAELSRELKRGDATFTASVTDSSVWKNASAASVSIDIDTTPPQLAVLSLQHRMYAGGAELVIFEARDDQELADISLTVGDTSFLPVRLADADEKYASFPDAYAMLFAVPRGFPKEDFQPALHASDAFGNRSTYPLSFTFVEKPLRESSPSLSQKFLTRKIPPLFDEMKREGLIEGESSPALVSAFKEVNEGYRSALGEKLKALLANKVTNSIPTSQFVRPMAGKLMSPFGEARNYTFQKNEAGYSTHDGQDIASVRGDKVVSTYQGTVVMSEPFGIYGNTVVVDHGLGITSLYGHLSTLSVAVGDTVETGQEVGRSGETGLAGGDHLHFEIRIQNVPVTPIEWWDKKWFGDNITLKFDALEEPTD